MEIKIDSLVTVDDYIHLRSVSGWKNLSKKQLQKGLENTMYQVRAVYNNETVGMARLVGDYSFTGLLTGVIVHPDYQGKKIGSMMIQHILDYVYDMLESGEQFQIELLPTAGRRDFYLKLGFKYKPKNMEGLYLWVKK